MVDTTEPSQRTGSFIQWDTLGRWSARAFLAGGGMFIVAATLSAVAMITGTDRLHRYLGEAFIAFGWIGGLVGLLGLYRGLTDQNRWLARAGGLFATIGLVAFTVLAMASLVVFFTGGSISALVPGALLLLGVIVGSLLAFVSFSVATFRSDGYSRAVSLLLLVPSTIFVTNFFVLPVLLGSGPNPPEVGFVIVSALALSMLAIGHFLRTGEVLSERQKPGAPSELETG